MPSPVSTKRLTHTISQVESIPALVEMFLTERKARGLRAKSIEFYRFHLARFLEHCDALAIETLTDITADTLRRLLIVYGETHSEGGTHGLYRALRAFFLWLESEELPPLGWHNPIKKTKPPKVTIQPIPGASLAEIGAMVDTCKGTRFLDRRDKALLLCLLDTGARGNEFCNIDLSNVDGLGAILIKESKSRKPRQVYLGLAARKALRAYVRHRQDTNPALWINELGERLKFSGLRQILIRRAKRAGLENIPSPHDFRRCMAITFLRDGGDLITLSRLLGHADLETTARYLAQTGYDLMTQHSQHSPADKIKR